jgi:hypothetical protein
MLSHKEYHVMSFRRILIAIAFVSLVMVYDYQRVELVNAENRVHILQTQVSIMNSEKKLDDANFDAKRLNAKLLDYDLDIPKVCPAAVQKYEALSDGPIQAEDGTFTYTAHLPLQMPAMHSIGWGPRINRDLMLIDWILDECLYGKAKSR